MGKAISQAELGKVFGHSQNWVSKQQRRHDDPMPKDLAGARAWGIRNKLLADPAAPDQADAPLLQAQTSAVPSGLSERDAADITLKQRRADLLEIERQAKTGELVPRDEMIRRETVMAAEFRRMACDFALRARAVLDRHLHDAEVKERIMADFQPIAAEVFNHADPHQVLKGRPLEELRAILLDHVEGVLACCS